MFPHTALMGVIIYSYQILTKRINFTTISVKRLSTKEGRFTERESQTHLFESHYNEEKIYNEIGGGVRFPKAEGMCQCAIPVIMWVSWALIIETHPVFQELRLRFP